MRRIFASLAILGVLALGSAGVSGCGGPKTPEQKASASAAASKEASKERDSKYLKLLGGSKLTLNWGDHPGGLGKSVAMESAVFDVDGGKVYMLSLGNNERNCYAVIRLVSKEFPDNPVVTDTSPKPEIASKWTYRLAYIARGGTPLKPQQAPIGAVPVGELKPEFSAPGISRGALEKLIADAADNESDADHNRLSFCAPK